MEVEVVSWMQRLMNAPQKQDSHEISRLTTLKQSHQVYDNQGQQRCSSSRLCMHKLLGHGLTNSCNFVMFCGCVSDVKCNRYEYIRKPVVVELNKVKGK